MRRERKQEPNRADQSANIMQYAIRRVNQAAEAASELVKRHYTYGEGDQLESVTRLILEEVAMLEDRTIRANRFERTFAHQVAEDAAERELRLELAQLYAESGEEGDEGSDGDDTVDGVDREFDVDGSGDDEEGAG